jgi:outer membrane protein OmpA-like peptidoglycan-associated protein
MEWIVQFPQSGSFLTDEAKAILNQIGEDAIVDVVGTASPEGNKAVNQRLSEKRAAVVADYLTKRGVKVNSWCGKGVQIGKATNRLAVVTVHK